MNFAPRMPTIIVALALVVIGMLGTFVGVLPSLGGMSGETIGVWAYIVAGAVLLVGIVVEGL